MRKKLSRGKLEKLNLCFSEQMLAWRDYKLMMSTWGLESAKATNNDLLYGEPDTLLTCNKRCSIQGDERVWAVLQVSHYMFHHSVHCLDQSADHRGGLLLENNDPTRKSWQLIHCFWFSASSIDSCWPIKMVSRFSFELSQMSYTNIKKVICHGEYCSQYKNRW